MRSVFVARKSFPEKRAIVQSALTHTHVTRETRLQRLLENAFVLRGLFHSVVMVTPKHRSKAFHCFVHKFLDTKPLSRRMLPLLGALWDDTLKIFFWRLTAFVHFTGFCFFDTGAWQEDILMKFSVQLWSNILESHILPKSTVLLNCVL